MSAALESLRADFDGLARTGVKFSVTGSHPVERRSVRTQDGRSIAYVDTGSSGADVVLIHGTLMTLEDMWLGLMPMLASEFRVVAVDRPGHGDSQRSRLVDASPWRQADIIHDAMVTIGLRRPTIVGHSAGGAVALAYGMLFPDDVAGVVALAPICFPEPRLEQFLFGVRAMPFVGEMLAIASRMGPDTALLPTLWHAMFLPQRMPAVFETGFPFGLAGRASQMVAEAEDSLALGPGLLRSAFAYEFCRVPVEVLGGDADMVINNLTHGYRAAAIIPGGHYHSLPGVGHMLHHIRPGEVLDAIRRVHRNA